MGTELPQSMTLVQYLVQTASLRIESTTDYNRTPPAQNKWGSEKWTYPIFEWSITGLLWSGTSSLDTIRKPDKNIRILTRFASHLFLLLENRTQKCFRFSNVRFLDCRYSHDPNTRIVGAKFGLQMFCFQAMIKILDI